MEPVWTFSVANVCINLDDDVDGIVFSSSVTHNPERWKIHEKFPDGIINMNLAAIKMPVLIIAHQDDGCEVTPPDNT